ncbi:Peptidase A2 domain-containing protein [Caenorhabditis elegans]|uniref:Peptidase A2 domain-containing protein n=1 Tax=Caenorhabditis elegans TaxID=6239 RepID=A0A5C3DPT3_CAEEL|nr:Peptidase A2 domain-containing protein [Caenorhabditis elegans]SPC48722.2 Peptidase A2 domain-containing protein [Caenorhabditis elegans]
MDIIFSYILLIKLLFFEKHTSRDFGLPTVKAMAYNNATKTWESITIMIDKGADRSYISQGLADR